MANFFGSSAAVDKATVDNDTPTPGYMFSDISKLTFQGAKECERLRTQLLSKLKSTSPAVKIKVLMVLKYLLENGHPHFQTILQNKADEIRPCLDFKAPPDPLHGDAPSRLVRDKAALVMNALYETRTDVSYEYNQPPSTQGNPVTNTQTFTPAPGPGPNFGKGISSIEGPRPATPAKKGVIETLKEKAEETFKNVSNKDPSPAPTASKFKPLGGPVNYPRGGVFTSHHVSQSAFVDAPRDSGKPGGGWDTCEDNSQIPTGEEADLVNQFCSLKANNFVPTRPQITEFFNKVNGKDISMVTYYLALQLNNNDWKNRYRSLSLIQELLQSAQYKADVEEYFSVEENYAALTVLNSSVQKTIRDKLAQVISLLPTSASLSPIPNAQPTDSIEDGSLFGGLNISENSILPQDEPNSDESIFGGISITPEPTPAVVTAPTQNVSIPIPTPNGPAGQKVVSPSTQPNVVPVTDQNTTQFPFIQATNQQQSFPTNQQTQDTKQLLSDIFNPNQTQPQTQNKINPAQMSSLIQNPSNPPNTIPFGYPPNTGVPMQMPAYNYPQGYPPYGYPYYPPYPGYPVQSPYPSQPQAQQPTTTTPSVAFDFVASETVQKKDPFDFIKVGQI